MPKRVWQDHLEDGNGNVLQEGTPLNADNLNAIENDLETLSLEGNATKEQVTKNTQDVNDVKTQLADTAKKSEARLKTEKLKPEDLSEETLGLVTGTGTVNLLSIPQDGSVSPKKTTFMSSTRNLFDGKYYPYSVSGTPGVTALLYNTDNKKRTAIVPIIQGKTYTIKVHEPALSNNFRVGTHTSIPIFSNVGSVNLTEFLVYSDALKQYSFTANLTGFVFITVSSNNNEPKIQVEEGSVPTDYVENYILREAVVEEAIRNNSKLTIASETALNANNRLDNNLLIPSLSNVSLHKTDPGARLIEYFGGKMWGYTGGNGAISYSTDEGKNWTIHTSSWNTEWGWIARLLPTTDGEVLAMSATNLRKSSGWNSETVSWSENKITKHPNATFFQFGFDGDGTKFIIAEYANGKDNWSDSRFIWISIDSGNTFKVVWDSLEKYGADINRLTHLHGVCYDRWGDRFYFAEGHSPSGGIYCSTNNGTTWIQGVGHRDGVLKSTGIEPRHGDTNGPTVLVATDKGLVMGSDNSLNGMFGMLRKKNPADEVITRTFAANYSRPGLIMFAIRGWRDGDTGTVYITFRSEFNDVPPIICAGTPTDAKVIYEYPSLPVVGAQDHFGAIAKVSDERLVSYAQFGGTPYTMRADLSYPKTEISTLIRIELRKLGLLQ